MLSGNLFTTDYLLEGITRTPQWRALDGATFDRQVAQLKKLANAFQAHAKPSEAVTEKDFIYPVLEVLGWTDIVVQPNLSTKGRKQVPDALLLSDAHSKSLAVKASKDWEGFKFGLAILEAKKWERELDTGKRGEEGAPDTQMLHYLSRVDIQTSGRVRLGILTNGAKWRLYFQGALSVADDFFEVDLAKCLQCPGHELDIFDIADKRKTREHCLRLFLIMFGREAFLPVEGPLTFHDISRETGKVWEEQVTKDLSRLVFGELFPKLVSAIAENDRKRPQTIDNSYLESVRQSALVLLYRLLFVVYAEDRDLLPDNQQPYKDFSFTTMRLEIAKRKADEKKESTAHATFWPRLTAIFKALSEGDNTFGIPPYNGGLFAKETAPLLSEVQLPDAIVTDLIYGLSHRLQDGQPRYINYRDLSVQQLGSVYERTLEYTLKADGSRVVINADDTARHESGSYYTPDNLVMLVIEKAVGPFVVNALTAFHERAAALAEDKRPVPDRLRELRTIDPAKIILDLKVCDPAMGSGHFLVSLVDWLADKVLSAIGEAESSVDWGDYESALAHDIAKTRDEIIEHALKNKWPYVAEHLQDRHIVRRMVLKRCVYGVDKNPLAVELAKVALWLHTFTVGAPLSFLDHHLRCGDSLFGAWVRPAMDRLVEWGSPLLMDAPLKRAFGAAAAMQTIEKLTDADIAEVYQSKNLFDGIESMTSELTGLLNVVHAIEWLEPKTKPKNNIDLATVQAWTKGSFGDPVKLATGATKLVIPSPPVETEMEKAKRELQGKTLFNEHETATKLNTWLPEINARILNDHCLHWQVVFPGIWHSWEGAELHGGFDAVIGNPPYVRQELIKEIKPALKRAFEASYDGAADLYVYFYDQGLRLLRPGGRLSYVVTNKWMRAGYADGLRNLLTTKSWVEFIADFGHAKKFFPDADVFPSVLVVRKPNQETPPQETQVCVIARDDVPEKALDEAVIKATFALPRRHFTREAWSLESPAVVALFEKIQKNSTPLADYVGSKPYRGILTGLNEAYLIDGPTRDALVRQNEAAADVIHPYLRGQDIRRWVSPDTDLYMIVMKSSDNYVWPWSGANDEKEAEKIFKATYPSLHAHFKKYESFVDAKGKQRGLRKREDQGRWWWELRSCAYYDLFEKPRIAYQAIQFHPRYSLDVGKRFGNNKTFMFASEDLGLLAALNSPLCWWVAWRHFIHLKDEALSNDQVKIATLPIATKLRGHAELAAAAKQMLDLKSRALNEETAITEWLRQGFGITDKLAAQKILKSPTHEAFTDGLKALMPRGRGLSIAEVGLLKNEYKQSVLPARLTLDTVLACERRISDLVMKAYGLNEADEALVWATAPPRMPYTPLGLADESEPDSGDDE